MSLNLETIIGLEVHAQMNTKTKMFCSCDNDAWGKDANTTVCPVCMGHPGTLPVPNKAVIEKAIRASQALKCTVNEHNHFDRKNYFYPDLPCGFQISQYKCPLASHGTVKFSVRSTDGSKADAKECRIHRLHIENDAGKLMHRGDSSLVDYNRAGTPLMEIVTEPDLRSAKDASAFAEELRRILIAAGSSEADMFKGMMRFDASISLRPKGDANLYPRVEIKNLNSFKSLERAINYQRKLLIEAWNEGRAPTSEVTVGWIDDEERTVLLRDKETAADYRYFPEPDIPPLTLDQTFIMSLKIEMEKLPSERKAEYISLGLTDSEATQLIDQPKVETMFTAIYEKTKDAKRASSLVLTQLLGFLKAQGKTIDQGPSADAMLELAQAIHSKTINVNVGKDVLEKMVVSGKSAKEIIAAEGLGQMTDDSALEKIVVQAIAENPQAIESFKAGKTAALGTVMGWIMKQTKGQADAGKVNAMLKEKIGG